MSDQSDPGRPTDPSSSANPQGVDPIAQWAGEALSDVGKAKSGTPGPDSLDQGDPSGQDPDRGDSAIEAGVATMLGQVAEAGEPKKLSRLRRSARYLLGLLVLVAVLAVVLDLTGVVDPLSCGNDADEQTPAQAKVSQTRQPQSAERPAGTEKPASSDAYLEARSALGLSTTPPESLSRYNSGSGPMRYEFTWLDNGGSETGRVGTVTMTRDDVLGNGRVTIEGSDAVGAYKMGKAAGAQNVAVDFAIRIPGPNGGDPRLIIFRTENTADFTLTGTAQPGDGGVSEPTWKVVGTQVR